MATLELSLAAAVMRLLDVQSALTAQRDMLLSLLRQQHPQPPPAGMPLPSAFALAPPPQQQQQQQRQQLPSAFGLAAPPLQQSAFAMAAPQPRPPSPLPPHSVFAAQQGQPLPPGMAQQAQQPRSPMDEAE